MATSIIERNKLESQTLLANMTRGGLDAGILEGLRESLTQVYAITDDFDQASVHIRESKKFTALGASQEVAEYAGRQNRKLFDIEVRAKNWRNMTSQIEKEMAPKSPPTLDSALTVELRTFLRGLSELERQILYENAVRTGTDPAMEYVIESAPPVMKLVRQDIIEKAKETRAARQNPDAATRLKTVNQALKVLEGAIAAARAHMGITEEDPLQVIKRTGTMA